MSNGAYSKGLYYLLQTCHPSIPWHYSRSRLERAAVHYCFTLNFRDIKYHSIGYLRVWKSCFTWHASAGRRQIQKITNLKNNVNIVKLHEYIWNHHEKCIQKSTNMPGIGSIIREIDLEKEFEKEKRLLLSTAYARVPSVNTHTLLTTHVMYDVWWASNAPEWDFVDINAKHISLVLTKLINENKDSVNIKLFSTCIQDECFHEYVTWGYDNFVIIITTCGGYGGNLLLFISP